VRQIPDDRFRHCRAVPRSVGANFRFTTTKGWLGWDERRWKVLDQDEKTPPAEVIAAVFETVRAIQEEARFVADTGVRWELKRSGKEQELDLETEAIRTGSITGYPRANRSNCCRPRSRSSGGRPRRPASRSRSPTWRVAG
jgi:hypothetical protein